MKFKTIKYLSVVIVAMLATSCEKDADEFLKDSLTIIGKTPTIASFSITPKQADTKVSSGATVKLDLRYWSDDPIDKINLIATRAGVAAPVSSSPYASAFSKVSKTDSLILTYQVPTGLAVGTEILMEAQVLNKNTLDAKSTLKLIVK